MKTVLLTLDESKAQTKIIFEMIRDLPVEMISPDRVANPENNPYRPSDRLHDSKADAEAIEDMTAQIEELSIFNPLLVVDEGDSMSPLIIASGVKRLKAAHAQSFIPVKCLKIDQLFPGQSAGWSKDKKKACLAETLQSIVFTESETNTKLSDAAVVSLLAKIRENQDVKSFDQVMPRLGLKREKSTYRNIKRLWGVVADQQLYFSFLDGTIPLELAKQDLTQKLFAQPDKKEQLLAKIKNYKDKLISSDPDNVTKGTIEAMKNYSRAEMDAILRDIDQKSEEDEKFVVLNFEVESNNGYLTVPKIDKLTVADSRRKNVAKVLDIFYNLTTICSQLQGYLDAVKPESVGGEIQKDRAISFSVAHAPYGEHYVNFINERNMQFYSKPAPVEEFYEKNREPLFLSSERDNIKKSELPAKIVNAFIERLKTAPSKKS